MLAAEFRRCDYSLPKPFGDFSVECADTLVASRARCKVFPEVFLGDHKLATLYKQATGEDLNGAHDALVDARAVAQLANVPGILNHLVFDSWSTREAAYDQRLAKATAAGSRPSASRTAPAEKDIHSHKSNKSHKSHKPDSGGAGEAGASGNIAKLDVGSDATKKMNASITANNTNGANNSNSLNSLNSSNNTTNDIRGSDEREANRANCGTRRGRVAAGIDCSNCGITYSPYFPDHVCASKSR